MDYNKLKSFRFWPKLDEAIMKHRYSGERRDSLYPSEASVIAIDPDTKEASVLGGCARKSWYRLMRVPPSDPTTTKSEYIFALGRIIEEFIADLSKKAGIYNNNSVKFWDRGSHVSGEIDLVVEIPVEETGYIFCEIKTTWGGKIHNGEEQGVARGLFDHHEGRGKARKFVKAIPKDGNMLQLATYLYTHRDDPDLIGGKLVYFLRDNCNRTEFDITIVKEGEKHRLMVNGEIDYRFFVEDIYARYAGLAAKVNTDTILLRGGSTFEQLDPPEKDFDLIYSEEQITKMHDNGDIGDTAYETHMKKKEYKGDWQCSYTTMAGVIAI